MFPSRSYTILFPEPFLQTSSPNVARAYHTATLLPNGKVLIAGGLIAGSQGTASTELYDPTAQTFTLAENMDAPRYNHTATLLNDGRVLIAEGVMAREQPELKLLPMTYTIRPAVCSLR